MHPEEVWRQRTDLLRVGQWIGVVDTSDFIVEFGDYQCPSCRRASSLLDSTAKAGHPKSVLFINLPIQAHVLAIPAAAASLCADEQGRGSEMHSLLMNDWGWQGDQDWVGMAKRSGVRNTIEFTKCLGAARTVGRIERSMDLASSLHVLSTPTFLRLDEVVVGVPTGAQLARMTENR